MKCPWNIFIPVLVVFLIFGCGSSGKKLSDLDLSAKDQAKAIKQTAERVDTNHR